MTLVELLMGVLVLLIAIISLFGVFSGSSLLNEQSRHRAWAMTDASRVMERLRQQNTDAACNAPSVAPPPNPPGGNFVSWDAWLADAGANGGGGKTLLPDPANELVAMSSSGVDPLTVTVAICWRLRSRVYGECQWIGNQLVPQDADGNLIITSPVMLSTVMTCRRP